MSFSEIYSLPCMLKMHASHTLVTEITLQLMRFYWKQRKMQRCILRSSQAGVDNIKRFILKRLLKVTFALYYILNINISYFHRSCTYIFRSTNAYKLFCSFNLIVALKNHGYDCADISFPSLCRCQHRDAGRANCIYAIKLSR